MAYARGFPPVADLGSQLERAEALADSLLPDRSPKRRMLVIVNPYATTVSDRLRNLVVYALQARYEVEAVDTEKRDHATQLCREAAEEGYDVVVAFGGDGTVNEAANGLAGSDTPLTCLPGGATNVFHRAIGIPTDVVEATEHLLSLADDFRPRRVDLGRINERYFTFSAGIGLDASVVERVDSHPRLKTRFGQYYYTASAVSTFNRNYLVNPPHVRLTVGGRDVEGVTVIAQNAEDYTYFGRRPIRLAPDVALNDGTLGLVVLKRATDPGAADRGVARVLGPGGRHRRAPSGRALRRHGRGGGRGHRRRHLPGPGGRRLHRPVGVGADHRHARRALGGRLTLASSLWRSTAFAVSSGDAPGGTRTRLVWAVAASRGKEIQLPSQPFGRLDQQVERRPREHREARGTLNTHLRIRLLPRSRSRK